MQFFAQGQMLNTSGHYGCLLGLTQLATLWTHWPTGGSISTLVHKKARGQPMDTTFLHHQLRISSWPTKHPPSTRLHKMSQLQVSHAFFAIGEKGYWSRELRASDGADSFPVRSERFSSFPL